MLLPTERGVAGASWCCAVLTPTGCSRKKQASNSTSTSTHVVANRGTRAKKRGTKG